MERAGIRIGFGIANLFVAVLAYGGIFRGLPSRWLPVDLAGIVVIALMGASGVALLLNRRGAAIRLRQFWPAHETSARSVQGRSRAPTDHH